MRREFPCIVVLFLAFNAQAQEPQPSKFKAPELNKAITDFEGELLAAKKSFADGVSKQVVEFNTQIAKIQSQHLERLGSFLKLTTQAADLDEALRIRDEVKRIEDTKLEAPNLQVLLDEATAKISDLEKQVAELLPAKDEKTGRRASQTIVGLWRWFDGYDVTITAKGQASHPYLKGEWKRESDNTFICSWTNGSNDTLVVSADGRLIEGRASLDGKRIWAVRIK